MLSLCCRELDVRRRGGVVRVRPLVAVVGAGLVVLAVAGCGTDSGASTPTTVSETVTVKTTAGRGADAAPAPAPDGEIIQYTEDGIYPVAGDTIDPSYSRIPAGWYVLQTSSDAGDRGSWTRCRTLACGPNDVISSGTIDGGSTFVGAIEVLPTDAAFKMTGLQLSPGVSPIG